VPSSRESQRHRLASDKTFLPGGRADSPVRSPRRLLMRPWRHGATSCIRLFTTEAEAGGGCADERPWDPAAIGEFVDCKFITMMSAVSRRCSRSLIPQKLPKSGWLPRYRGLSH
jgi:hypothetical protein